MQPIRSLSVIAVLTSLIIVSDFVLAPVLNVKLMDTIVFSTAFVFGFRTGATVAVLSEFIWSIATPYGMYLPITPFLVLGELLFAFAGYAASKIWGAGGMPPLSSKNLYFGSILAICAFTWDFETNIGSGLTVLWPHISMLKLLGFEVSGIFFMIPHELSDFVLGSALAPIMIMYFRRLRVASALVKLVEKEIV